MPILIPVLTPELLCLVRTRLTNVIGREPSIWMLAYADYGNGYGLAYGTVGVEDGSFTPFTMRADRDDLRLWDRFNDEDPGQVTISVATLVGDFASGYEKDPHA